MHNMLKFRGNSSFQYCCEYECSYSLPDGDVTHPRMHRAKCKQRHFGRIEKLALLSRETLLFYNGRQLLCTRVPEQEGQVKGRVFYRLPKDEPRRSKWIAAIKRAKSNVNKTEKWHPSDSGGYRLCSDHFISGKTVTESVNHVNVTSVYSEFE